MQAKVKSIYFNHPSQVNSTTTKNYYIIWFSETRLHLPEGNKYVDSLRSEWSIDTVIHFYFYFFLIHRRALCSQPIRGNVRRTGRIFPEHVERSFLDPEYSFVAVRRILRTIFAKQKFAQLRTNYIRRILLCSRTNVHPIKNGLKMGLIVCFAMGNINIELQIYCRLTDVYKMPIIKVYIQTSLFSHVHDILLLNTM